MSASLPVTFAHLQAAAARIAPMVVRTPVLRSGALDDLCGRPVLVKAECLQPIGSFKIRGAMNALAAQPQARANGVVAFSSGNHAQGVAAAARWFGVPATIVMPADAPAAKIGATRALGAKVHLYDRLREDRKAIAEHIQSQTGALLVPPFDDRLVIAGQGSVGLELVAQASACGVELEAVLVCASGGGLVAGIALAMQALRPRTAVFSVEPIGHDDLARSLASGVRERNAPGVRSICDALLVEQSGELTFEINRALLAGGLAVSDDQVRAAMLAAWRHLHLVVEPGGAVALAAALAGLAPGKGPVGVILSGGNVDPGLYAQVLSA